MSHVYKNAKKEIKLRCGYSGINMGGKIVKDRDIILIR